MKKVLHCISDTNVGGAGILLRTLLTEIKSDTYAFAVCLPLKSRLTPLLQESGIATIELPVTGDRSFAWRDLSVFLRFFRSYRPDILHTHGSLTARIAAKILHIPVITTRHCAWPDSLWFHLPYRLLSGLLSGLSDCYIATAEAARKNLRQMGIPDKKIVTVVNGSPKKAFCRPAVTALLRSSLGIHDGDFVVTAVARLSPEKGLDILLAAAFLLEREGIFCHYLLLGDGAEKERLQKLAERYRLTRVHFLGFQPDTSPYLSFSSMVINCSRGTETSCLALSEAMSLALPVAATCYGGNSDMIRDGDTGILFAVNSPAACADAIRRLYRSPSLCRRLGNAGYTYYRENFTPERMCRQYLRLYDRILCRNSRRRKPSAPRTQASAE